MLFRSLSLSLPPSHTHTHTHTHTHVHTHTRTHTRTHIHTHVHTQTHTYTHIHTHVHTHVCCSQLGVGMASAGEMSFNWTGFLTAMASNLTFGFRAVWSKRCVCVCVIEDCPFVRFTIQAKYHSTSSFYRLFRFVSLIGAHTTHVAGHS